MGSVGSTSGRTNANVSTQPWVVSQPFHADYMGQARDLYNLGGTPFYPGQTYANFNPYQMNAFSQIQGDQNLSGNMGSTGRYAEQELFDHSARMVNDENNPHSLSFAGKQQLRDTARGDMFRNPYLDSMYDQAAQSVRRNYEDVVQPSIGLQFSRAGRTGSAAEGNQQLRARESLGQQLTGLANNMYGQAYAQERANQLGAAQFGADQGFQRAQFGLGQVPTYVGLRNQRQDRLLGLGGQVEAKSQQMIDDDMARFDHTQMASWDNLMRYIQAINAQQLSQSHSESSGRNSGFNLGVG